MAVATPAIVVVAAPEVLVMTTATMTSITSTGVSLGTTVAANPVLVTEVTAVTLGLFYDGADDYVLHVKAMNLLRPLKFFLK